MTADGTRMEWGLYCLYCDCSHFPPEGARIYEDLVEDIESSDQSKEESVVEGQEVPDLEMAKQLNVTLIDNH